MRGSRETPRSYNMVERGRGCGRSRGGGSHGKGTRAINQSRGGGGVWGGGGASMRARGPAWQLGPTAEMERPPHKSCMCGFQGGLGSRTPTMQGPGRHLFSPPDTHPSTTHPAVAPHLCAAGLRPPTHPHRLRVEYRNAPFLVDPHGNLSTADKACFKGVDDFDIVLLNAGHWLHRHKDAVRATNRSAVLTQIMSTVGKRLSTYTGAAKHLQPGWSGRGACAFRAPPAGTRQPAISSQWGPCI